MGSVYPDRPLSLTWQPEYHSDNYRNKSLPQTLLGEFELGRKSLPQTPLNESQKIPLPQVPSGLNYWRYAFLIELRLDLLQLVAQVPTDR